VEAVVAATKAADAAATAAAMAFGNANCSIGGSVLLHSLQQLQCQSLHVCLAQWL